MPVTSFSAALVRNPVKAAQDQAWRRHRIATAVRQRNQAAGVELRAVYARIEKALAEEGRCTECGRQLTAPASIAVSVGPDCLERLVLAARAEDGWRQAPLADGAEF